MNQPKKWAIYFIATIATYFTSILIFSQISELISPKNITDYLSTTKITLLWLKFILGDSFTYLIAGFLTGMVSAILRPRNNYFLIALIVQLGLFTLYAIFGYCSFFWIFKVTVALVSITGWLYGLRFFKKTKFNFFETKN